jgi:hypothetical protein
VQAQILLGCKPVSHYWKIETGRGGRFGFQLS